MEIRFTVAWTLRKRRRAAHITQAELAARSGVTRNTISRIERASNRVALDHAVRALIELGCSDDDVANALNPALNPWRLAAAQARAGAVFSEAGEAGAAAEWGGPVLSQAAWHVCVRGA